MTLHDDAVDCLHAWQAPAGRQSALRERYLNHLRAHPDGMERGCFPDHLTAGVIVLSPDLDHVLLNLHRKARRWFAFGGHCEPGDTTLAGAALREGLEESGLEKLDLDPTPVQLDLHEVDFCNPRGTVRHLDVRFSALAPESPERSGHQVSDESLDVRWWPVAGLPDDLEDDMHALVSLARERWSGLGAAQSPSRARTRAPGSRSVGVLAAGSVDLGGVRPAE